MATLLHDCRPSPALYYISIVRYSSCEQTQAERGISAAHNLIGKLSVGRPLSISETVIPVCAASDVATLLVLELRESLRRPGCTREARVVHNGASFLHILVSEEFKIAIKSSREVKFPNFGTRTPIKFRLVNIWENSTTYCCETVRILASQMTMCLQPSCVALHLSCRTTSLPLNSDAHREHSVRTRTQPVHSTWSNSQNRC